MLARSCFGDCFDLHTIWKQDSARSGSSEHLFVRWSSGEVSWTSLSDTFQGRRRFPSSYVTPLSHLRFCISLEILHSMLGCGWGGYRVWSPTPDDAGVGGGGKQWVGLGAGSWRMTRRDSCSTAAALASGPCCAGELDSVRPLLRSSL